MSTPQPQYSSTGEFSPDGKSGSVSASIYFSGGTPTGPGYSNTYTLTVPAGNLYSISVSADDTATVSGEGITASSHWDASAKCIVPGAARSSTYQELAEGAEDVTFTITYENVGGPFYLSATVTSTRTPKDHPEVKKGDEKCECTTDCPMNSNTALGSVDFSQPFGRTPFAQGFSSGTLVLKKQITSDDLFTPAGLQYDHFLTRKAYAVDATTQSATISADGIWENIYVQGVPETSNAWKSSRVQVAPDGTVTETLSSRTVIRYDTSGAFLSVTSPEGVTLTKNQLGVEVIRDENGALRQIWSLADGLLDIVSVSDLSYEIRWYKTESISGKDATSGLYTMSGEPVKVFVCGAPADTTNVFKITERRGTTFEFENTWTFNALANEWTLDKGDVHLSRLWTEQEDGNFLIAETRTDASGNAEVFTETISPANGNQYVGKTRGGITEFSATRVTSGNGLGKIASETERSGATRNYTYDTYGRVTCETLSSGFGGLAETTEYTYAPPASGTVDLRPRTIVHKIAGTIFKTENFTYNDDANAGRAETHSVMANGTTLTSETRYYPANTNSVSAGRVKYNIRADGTATFYEYSETEIPGTVDLSSNLSYTKTETVGVWENGAFSPVPGKSTRIVRNIDTRGNEIRTENYVHAGTAFELVAWENKTYAPTHKVIATTRSDGKTSSADYICTGPVWTIDENGVRTDNTFDEAKRLKTSTRHGARGDVVTTYTYDADGRVVAETKSAGALTQTTSRTYHADGSLATETDALGNVTRYAQSADGLTETVTYPDGGMQTTVRNANGETLSVTGTAVVAKYYSYAFENGLKVTTVYTGTQNGSRWEKTYADGHGRTMKTERPGFGENVTLSSENTYDSKGRLIATVSTGQPSVAYAHDALGNVVETLLGEAVFNRFNDAGEEDSVTRLETASPTWRKTATESVYEKDVSGIIWQKTTNTVSCSDETIPAQTSVSKTQLSGLSLALESKQISTDLRGNETVTTSAYVPETKTRTQTTAFPQMTDVQTSVTVDGVVTSQTAPGGVTTSAVYDAFNRGTSATDARGNLTHFAYNAKGQVVSQTQSINGAAATTSFAYDPMGRQTRTTLPDGTWIASAYDLRGNKIAEYGNASYPLTFTFDAFNQKTQMQTFRTLAGSPEELANLTGGDVTTWTYDPATGLLLTKTDAANQATSYTYTASGLLATRTWARGITTVYAYDAWNQLTSTTYSDSTPAIAQTYDALGRTVSVTDAAGITAKTYNAYGNIASETQSAFEATLSLSYDTFGRETSCTVSRDTQLLALFGQSYEAASGRLANAAYGAIEFTYNYLAGTNLLASLANAFVTKQISYESSRDLPVEIAYNDSVGTLLAKRNYTYDTLGRVAARTQTRGTETPRNDSFGYNTRSELTSATLGSDNYAYAFDNIGNRQTASESGTTSSYTTNNLNQYQAIISGEATLLSLLGEPSSGNSSPTYFTPLHDADGNTVLIRTSTGVWQITYNGENRPVRFENATTETVITCAYDSQGRRFEKKVSVSGTITSWERYLYRDYLQIAAFDVSQSGEAENYALKHIIFWDPSEPTATRPLAINILGDQLYFPTVDITKNVCELVDVSGTLAATYDYAPFGAVTSSGTVSNPLQWSSEIYDSELGLVYYNYRHYSPLDGRFLSRDPIEEQGGVNLYAFVGNRLLLSFDRNGWLAEKITISATQVPVESGYVPGRFLAMFQKGTLSISLHLKEGLNFCGSLVAEGKAEGMKIVYKTSFERGTFLTSSEYRHELKHFEIYKNEYNSLVDDVNSYDGKNFTILRRVFCDCTKKLSDYVKNRKDLFRKKCKLEDLKLEFSDYNTDGLAYYYNTNLKPEDKISSKTPNETDFMYKERVRSTFYGAISSVEEEVKSLEDKVNALKEKLSECF